MTNKTKVYKESGFEPLKKHSSFICGSMYTRDLPYYLATKLNKPELERVFKELLGNYWRKMNEYELKDIPKK